MTTSVQFTLDHYGYLVGWETDSWDNIAIQLRECFGSENYSDDFDEIYYNNAEVSIERFINNKQALKILEESCYFFSMKGLEAALKIKKLLIEKHRKAEASLDEILGGN